MNRRFNPSRITYATMLWSKAFVPVIALLAAVASSIRTVQTTAEIYTASGSNPMFVMLAAAAFTISVEGALFALALAQENQQMKWRAAHKKRNVVTLATIIRGIAVRFGLRQPLSYDQIPESDGGLNTLLMIAFAFAITSNLYLGLRPLTDSMKASSLQSFIASLLNARAELQLQFVVDLAGVLFPPFMALKAGHLTARFAAEISAAANRQQAKVERAKVVQSDQPIEQRSKKRTMNASERIKGYLNEHPEAFDGMSQRQIAKELQVSVGSVNQVINAMKADQFSSNGRH